MRLTIWCALLCTLFNLPSLQSAQALTCPAGFTTVTASICKLRFTTGTSTWTVPAGVTTVEVFLLGGGAGGGSASSAGAGGGGGGGGINYSQNYSVTPGAGISVTVGNGGSTGSNGGQSSFGSLTVIGGYAGSGASSGGAGGSSGTRISPYTTVYGGHGCEVRTGGNYPQAGSSSVDFNSGLFATSPITGVGAGGWGGGPTYTCTGSAMSTNAGSANLGNGGGGGQYSSGVGVSGGSGFVEIRITDPADATPPTFTSSSSFSVNENISTSTTAATITVSESASVTISAGADAADFSILYVDSATARITFVISPNYEIPVDADVNNIYLITVRATDSTGNSSTQDISISVVDVIEISIVGTTTFSRALEKGIPVTVTASVNVSGKARFLMNNKRIAKCLTSATTGSSPNYSVSCTFLPAIQGAHTLTIQFTPTNNAIASSSKLISISVNRRTALR
jgi:hypothetical protein